MTKTELSELIQRRRLQVLIHSCIYYEFNQNLVTDNQWATWALELEQLQNKYPETAAEVIWAESFKNFDHSTVKILTIVQVIIYLHVTLGLWVEQNG